MAKSAVRAIIVRNNSLLLMKRNKFGMLYYTLPGGGVDVGEQPETALRREVQEELSMQIGRVKHVYTEDGGDIYGVQYVFYCEDIGGEPHLDPNSEEALISQLGQNTYEPVWLPVAELPKIPLRSDSVKQALIVALAKGFPETAQELVWKAEVMASLDDDNGKVEV